MLSLSITAPTRLLQPWYTLLVAQINLTINWQPSSKIITSSTSSSGLFRSFLFGAGVATKTKKRYDCYTSRNRISKVQHTQAHTTRTLAQTPTHTHTHTRAHIRICTLVVGRESVRDARRQTWQDTPYRWIFCVSALVSMFVLTPRSTRMCWLVSLVTSGRPLLMLKTPAHITSISIKMIVLMWC